MGPKIYQNIYKMLNKRKQLKVKIYNHLMFNGNKSICEQIFLKSSKILQKFTNKNHKNLIKLAIINGAPIIQMKQIKKNKRKTVKEFPFVLNKRNRTALSIKSIFRFLREKQGTKFYDKLPNEIITSSQNKSDILKSRESSQEQALTKKKYAFFRWFC